MVLPIAVIIYSIVWLAGMYFILKRLYIIRERTVQRIHDYDAEYMLPNFRRPWITSVVFGVIVYAISIFLIITLLSV